MSLNRAKKDAIERRREHVASFRVRGLSLREIVVALSKLETDPITVSHVTVKADLDVLTADWQARAAEAIDARKARQLAEIDEAKRKAWADGDVANLLKAIKLESDIFGTMAPTTVKVKTWQDDVVDLLRMRKVAPAEVVSEYGASLAAELFAQAGVDVNDAA